MNLATESRMQPPATSAEGLVVSTLAHRWAGTRIVWEWQDDSNSTVVTKSPWFSMMVTPAQPVVDRVWPYNVFLGVQFDVGTSSTTTAERKDGRLFVEENATLSASQAPFEISLRHAFVASKWRLAYNTTSSSF